MVGPTTLHIPEFNIFYIRDTMLINLRIMIENCARYIFTFSYTERLKVFCNQLNVPILNTPACVR